MADVNKTIEILFTAVDQTSGAITDISGGLGNLNDSVRASTQPFADLASGVLKADAALATIAGGGLAFAFVKAKDFQAASVELQKVVGDLPDVLARAEQEAFKLSGTYGESAAKTLESTAFFKQAGFDINDSLLLTQNALDLVIAGDLEAAQASGILVSALKGFKSPAEDAIRLIDVLNEVSNNYATDVEQLGIGVSKVSPITQQLGFTMEETAGLVTPIIEVFRSGDEAAVALKTGLSKLVDDSKPVQDALASIGVAQKDANGNLRSGRDIYLDVAKAFQTVDEKQKLALTTQLFGIQQSARLVTVFDNLDTSLAVTATALGSVGSASAEVEARLGSAEVTVNRFKQGFVNLATIVGNEFLDAATGTVEGGIAIESALTEVVSAGTLDPLFNALDGALDQLAVSLAQTAAELPEAFENVDFSVLLGSFENLGDSLGGVFENVDFSTADGLTDIIQLVTDSIAGLLNVSAGLVEGATPFLRFLENMGRGFADLDEETQKSIGDLTGFLASINKLTGPIGGLLDAVGGLGAGLNLLVSIKLLQQLGGSAGLAGIFGSIAASAKGLATVLTGPVGAALVGTGLLVGAAVEGYSEWQDAEKDLADTIKRGNDARDNLVKKFAEISEATGIQIENNDDLRAAVEAGTIALNAQTGEWEKLLTAEEQVAEATEKAESAQVDWGKTLTETGQTIEQVALAMQPATKAIDANREAAIQARAAYFELKGTSPQLARAMAEIEVGTKKGDKALKDTEEQTEKTKDKLLELASNERIKEIEFATSLKLAKLEGDSEKAKAIIGSIGTTIQSTGSLLGDLFGQLSTAKLEDKFSLQQQIKEENDERKKALSIQTDLVEEELRLARERRQALAEGGGVIKFEADNLAPELELVLEAILRNIQLRVAGEGGDMILQALETT